jgi:hypothetical protein
MRRVESSLNEAPCAAIVREMIPGTRLGPYQVDGPIGATAEAPGVRVRLIVGWPRLLERGLGEPQ